MNDVPVSAALSGDVPSPPETAPAGQGTLSAEASAARAELADLKNDPDFTKAYVAGSVEARERMDSLHECAFPEPEADTTPPPATPAEAAKARIEELRADPAFVANYEAGDQNAYDELARLDAQAAPELLPFAFDEDTPVSTMTAANEAAHGIAEALGVDSGMASGAVKLIERAHAERLGEDGVPKPMDQLELAKLDYDLQAHFGDDYDAQMDRVEAALQRAGGGADWLRKAILSSDPATAQWAFVTLAGLQGDKQ